MKTPLKLNYLILTIFTLSLTNAWGNCPEFETALEKAMARVSAKEAERASRTTPTTQAANANTNANDWTTPEANSFKERFSAEARGKADNRAFITAMEKGANEKGIIHFDVENAVQKKLNDSIVRDKGMVDAINNSYMTKFNKNLNDDPILMARLEGQYQDFKGLRLRIKLKDGDDAAAMEKKLNDLYKKTNAEFTEEFEKNGLTKLIPPRTDETVDVSTWFLAGTGDNALEANMAARGARYEGFRSGNSRAMSFKEQAESMFGDMKDIEKLRRGLGSDEALLKSGIMIKTETGEVIPSKDMIGILRKIKLADCDNVADYYAKIRAKTKTLFNDDISDKHIEDLTEYFKKVDSFSPPLFQRERVAINLGEAKSGIVSVDFTGVGVDNAFEQMKALSKVNYNEADKLGVLKDAFGKVQSHVDNVTNDMNMAKRAFTTASNDTKKPLFSGDDGILMPDTPWESIKKEQLIRDLAKTGDPSKFRVTFVRTEFSNGGTIPAAERSARVVRAESIEKGLREAVIGVNKISSERAKKMIFAIDSRPATKGGKYNLYIGGEKPTAEELKLIEEAFKKSLKKDDSESFGMIIQNF